MLSENRNPDRPLSVYGPRMLRILLAMVVALSLVGVTGTLPAEAARGKTLSVKSLRSAPIPASCSHGATRVKNYQREFGIAGFARIEKRKAKIGKWNGKRAIAVPLACSAGGSPWPNLLLVYAKSKSGRVVLVETASSGSAPSFSTTPPTIRRIKAVKGGFQYEVHAVDLSGGQQNVWLGKLTSSKKKRWQVKRTSTPRALFSDQLGDVTASHDPDRGLYWEASPEVRRWAPNDVVAFGKSRAQQLSRNPTGCIYSVNFAMYAKRGAALVSVFSDGGEGVADPASCTGGAEEFWLRSGGKWRAVYASNGLPPCSQLSKRARSAFKLLGQTCSKPGNDNHRLGKAWPNSAL
jgi:hypothetical protein